MKISDITPAPWNTRTAITDESVRSLAASMEADGLIQPISVCDNADGDGYICYDGNRRLAAARLLGWDEIAANYTDITPDEAKVRTITANLQRDADDPLLAAGVIAALLADGLDAGRIAAKLGKTAAWVNRRRKMIGAADALKAVADKVTVDALETVAALPEKTQAAVCKEIERKAGYLGRVGLRDIKYDIEREMRDLDAAKFDRDACRECLKRTGVEADLFGVADGELGKCLDCKCFEQKVKAHEDAEIARLTDGADEVVRFKYAWESHEGAAHARDKRDKKHPCAYVFAGNGEIEVKWGESAKAKKAREDAEREEREAAEAAEEEGRRHIREIEKKFESWSRDTDTDAAAKLVRAALKAKNRAATDWIVTAAADALVSWHGAEDWADLARAFDTLPKCAGVSEDELKDFLDAYPEDEDGDEE